MSALIFMTDMRMDLTCKMKDADEILEVFEKYGITFTKKYTSIHRNTESTITFVGIGGAGAGGQAKITDGFMDIHALAASGDIGNVYLRSAPKKRTPAPPARPRFGPGAEKGTREERLL